MQGIRRIILSLCLVVPIQVFATPLYSDIYVYGDSLSDTDINKDGGNLRRSNGPLWVEYLAPSLGVSYDSSHNFAQSGATSSDILSQVTGYLSASTVDPSALYVVWGGADDLFNIHLTDPIPTIIAHIVAAKNDLAAAVSGLAGAGATHILVPNLPDLGLTPGAAILGVQSIATGASNLFNSLLDSALSGLDVVSLDTFTLLNNVVADPSLYGFTNVTGSCKADGADPACSGYLFYDVVHPTTQSHQLLSNFMYAVVVPEPPTITLFAAGMLLFGMARRGRGETNPSLR